MDRPASSHPVPAPATTENPVVAVGRKVKAALSTHQRPSVRILREPSSPRRGPSSQGVAEKSASSNLPSQGNSHEPQSNARLGEHDAAQANASSAPSNPNPSGNRLADARTRAGAAMRSMFGREETESDDESFEHEYDTETVDLLDCVDPEVSTLSTLTNVQNSLFVPSLGRILDRRATYTLSPRYRDAGTIDKLKASVKRLRSADGDDEKGSESERQSEPPLGRTNTITSTLTDSRYAVLPHGETLPGWTRAEKEELDDLVRHMLHSRRARMKRSWNGFLKYVRCPLGLFVTVYATLVTLFGAAWVFFLIGWISLGSKRDYIINVVDNVLVALFAIIGDGLAPFRAVDTYHMIYIAYYHRKTLKQRKRFGLPELADRNDLPDQRKADVQPAEVDIESLVARKIPRRFAGVVSRRIPKKLAQRMVSRNQANNPSYEYTVLTEAEQTKLEYHERKFSKSHTFYKPHETETHYAFPLRLLIAVVVLLDCHSALQITLGACTWGIPYETRPFALTTVILCFSITCNIMGGVLISMGDKRTRKQEVIERMMRQELTADAIRQIEMRWIKEADERGELDESVRRRLAEREEAEKEEIKKAWKVVPVLPKVLLGKGEDHRQPSLPQQARRSNSSVVSTGSASSKSKKAKPTSGAALPAVQEHPGLLSHPKPALTRGEEPPKENPGQRVLRLIRRADLDRS
ncbi:hypothetical protein BP6252_04897 [Coleophoma cylindrospora]|uniref:Integral membrane protein n=1 Tax=Coleophoma cylindrospora TaxID=1849047 RepID=A0A3D8S1T9_9HELO|nr:hypothetical protein BP6252_04897 [Coleophoma cylindrospora]